MKEAVAVGCRILGTWGHRDLIWGHVSARDPEGRGIWMKGNTLGFEEVEPDDVLLVDRDGNVLEGLGGRVGRHAEYPIHTEVMAARPDVGAVVHTHAEYCVALTAAGQQLRPVSHAANFFVPPDVPVFRKTSALIVTRELGEAVAEALGDEHALFLLNHGIVTCGKTVEHAIVRAVILERACYHQYLTSGFGDEATWTEPEESLLKRDQIFNDEQLRQAWNYLVRTAER